MAKKPAMRTLWLHSEHRTSLHHTLLRAEWCQRWSPAALRAYFHVSGLHGVGAHWTSHFRNGENPGFLSESRSTSYQPSHGSYGPVDSVVSRFLHYQDRAGPQFQAEFPAPEGCTTQVWKKGAPSPLKSPGFLYISALCD